MRAVIAKGLTLGQMVDQVIDGAAAAERDLCVAFLRRVANELPDEQLFPPNLTPMIVDLILDLADALEECEHFADNDNDDEGETLQ